MVRLQRLSPACEHGTVAAMRGPAPTLPSAPGQLTTEQYLRLVEQGVLRPEDRVELLEGVVVAMAHGIDHAAGVRRVDYALKHAVGDRAVVQVQLSLVQGEHSVPEPDVAVLPGRLEDYDHVHPSGALLVVEVADWSLPQDRLTKGAIYARNGVREYWIVNLRDQCVEVLREPRPDTWTWASWTTARRGEVLAPLAFPDARIPVDALLPARQS